MTSFSSHLDRGWELLAQQDVPGAEAEARCALEADPASAEAYNLLGYCAAVNGQAEAAVQAYRQAIALDAAYLEALLNAAEVCLHPLQDYAAAVRFCDQALEVAESDEEWIDTLLLKFDAVLGRDEGNSEKAKLLLEQMPPAPYPNAHHTFLIGRAYYEVGDMDRAAPLIEEAVKENPESSEAWYYLGLVCDERGEGTKATSAFLRTRELDLNLPLPPWSLDRQPFVKLAQKVIAQLDAVLGGYVRGAELFITDVPGVEIVADGIDPRAPLLLDGINIMDMPDVPCQRIFLYQRNLEQIAGSQDAIEEEIRSALEREIMVTFLETDADNRPQSELN